MLPWEEQRSLRVQMYIGEKGLALVTKSINLLGFLFSQGRAHLDITGMDIFSIQPLQNDRFMVLNQCTLIGPKFFIRTTSSNWSLKKSAFVLKIYKIDLIT